MRVTYSIRSNASHSLRRLPREVQRRAVPAGINASAKVLRTGIVRSFYQTLVRRTGNYLRSIFTFPAKMIVGSMAEIVVGVFYASYLEDGTRWIRARRTVQKAVMATEQSRQRAFNNAFRKEVRKIERSFRPRRNRRGRV